MIRVLHTSDWHLGQHFIGKSRLAEHQKLVRWLLEKVEEKQIDAVIIAGDVYDTGSPPSYARELYNQLVVDINKLGCQLIILGGNHDSVSTLNESKGLLKHLNAEVVSTVATEPDHQVITLSNRQGEPSAILCAIPYLRPRDLLQSQSDQSAKDKAQALGEAIAGHYQQIYALAEQKRAELGLTIPIIATGHLTAMGVKSSDSVRDIYVGNLEAFPASAFPPADYIALGHIHRPQVVAKSEHIRYCGSPIPLSFDEIGSDKQVLIAEFDESALVSVEPLYVPLFQPMQVIKGDLQSIEQQLQALETETNELPVWLSIEVETQDYLNDLTQRVEQLTEGLNVEVLLLRRARKQRSRELARQEKETLSELNAYEVFERRVNAEQFETLQERERLDRLKENFCQIVGEVEEEHGMAPSRPSSTFLTAEVVNEQDDNAELCEALEHNEEMTEPEATENTVTAEDVISKVECSDQQGDSVIQSPESIESREGKQTNTSEPLVLFEDESLSDPKEAKDLPTSAKTKRTADKLKKHSKASEVVIDQDDLFAAMLSDDTSGEQG